MSDGLRTERAAIAIWAATGHKALDWVYMAPEDERVRWCMHLGAAVIAAEDKGKVTPEVAGSDITLQNDTDPETVFTLTLSVKDVVDIMEDHLRNDSLDDLNICAFNLFGLLIDGANTIRAEAEVTHEVAELDPIVAAFINARTEYIEALRQTRGTDDQGDYNRWQGHAEARRQLAQSLGYTVPSEMGSTTRRDTE